MPSSTAPPSAPNPTSRQPRNKPAPSASSVMRSSRCASSPWLMLASLQCLALRLGNVVETGSLCALQRAQVKNDRPAVRRIDLPRVARHVAHAFADAFEQFAHRFVAQYVLVQVRRRHPGALHQTARTLVHHALTSSVDAVTGRAVDAKALLTVRHGLLGELDLRRESLGKRAIDLAPIEMIVVLELAHRDRTWHVQAHRALIIEEGVLALGLVLLLKVHVGDDMKPGLAVGRHARQRRQRKCNQRRRTEN